MAEWTPTPAEVKALLPTRIDGAAFAADTVPTSTEVSSLATQITAEVIGELAEFGGETALSTADLKAMAKWAATLGTAAQVEFGFFPEQAAAGEQSTAQQIEVRYEKALARLQRAIRASGTGGSSASASTVKTPSAVVADLGILAGASELLP